MVRVKKQILSSTPPRLRIDLRRRSGEDPKAQRFRKERFFVFFSSLRLCVSSFFCLMMIRPSHGQELELARVALTEPFGLARTLEYVEFELQTDADFSKTNKALVAVNEASGESIPCQIFNQREFGKDGLRSCSIIFPVSMQGHETKTLLLKVRQSQDVDRQSASDLAMTGAGLELRVANKYFVADLTRSDQAEPKSHASGQLRELLIKMGFDQLLTNAEDRVHWAPNFKRPELEFYTTIAHWEKPALNLIEQGPHLVRTVRQDLAPDHPEILLTAVYKFYANVPYFKFYSGMEMVTDLWLELLRNDEMTTDSMFSHVAFERPTGEIVDLRLDERHVTLKRQPIEADAPWLCFYNIDKGFAFGSIRLKYDCTNQYGAQSPTYLPHTQIGQWLDRRYWNRRLIHDHLTFVPKGSRYVEENAYLVFRIGERDRLEEIKKLARQLRNPIRVSVLPVL